MLDECNQDFFIYVPAITDTEALIPMPVVGETSLDSTQVHIKNPWNSEEWVRIPLGSQTIYARIRDALLDILEEI